MKKAVAAIIVLFIIYCIPCGIIFLYRDATIGYSLNPQDTVEAPYVYDLNTVSADQLQQISGIGPVTARKIIEFREKNGGFQSAEQLFDIDGIDMAAAASILQYVNVGG